MEGATSIIALDIGSRDDTGRYLGSTCGGVTGAGSSEGPVSRNSSGLETGSTFTGFTGSFRRPSDEDRFRLSAGELRHNRAFSAAGAVEGFGREFTAAGDAKTEIARRTGFNRLSGNSAVFSIYRPLEIGNYGFRRCCV